MSNTTHHPDESPDAGDSTSATSTLDLGSLRRRLLSGGSWALAGHVMAAAVNVGSSVMLARMLTPKEFGVYILAYSIVLFASGVGMLGLNQGIVRFVAESMGLNQPGRARHAVRTAFFLVLIGSAAAGGTFYLASGFVGGRLFSAPRLTSIAGWISVWIFLLALQLFLAESFRGFHDVRMASIFGRALSGLLLVSGLGMLWALGEPRLRTVMLLVIASLASTVLLSGWLLRGRLRTLSTEPHEEQPLASGAMLRVSTPMMLAFVLNLALINLDLWLVSAYSTKDDVALYGAANKLIMLVTTPLIVANAIVPPIIADMFAQRRTEELERILRRIATITALPTVVMFCALYFGGEFVLGNLFGNFYKQAAPILAILCVGKLVIAWGGSAGFVLNMTGHERLAVAATAICVVWLSIVGMWAIHEHGILGLSVVSAFTMGLQKLLLVSLARWRVGIWTHMRISLAQFQDTMKTKG